MTTGRSTTDGGSWIPIAWTAAALFLVVQTIVVMAVDGPLPGEIGLIRWLQGFGQPVPIFADVLRVTTATRVLLLIGAVPGALLIRRFGRRGVGAVVICLIAMLVVQSQSKLIVDRDRPTEEQVEVRAEHSSLSYPSGHSMSTTTVFGLAAGLAWSTGRRRWAVVATIPIVCTAVASGIHGVHWASDAIAGTIMGAAAARLALWALVPDAASGEV